MRSQSKIYSTSSSSEDIQNVDSEMKEEEDEMHEEMMGGEIEVLEMALTEEGLFYFVKVEGESENVWMPRSYIVEKNPKLLLKFYESKIITLD